MKRLLLVFVTFLALVVPSTANSIGYSYSLVKLPGGTNCIQSTSPPCQVVTTWPGFLRVTYGIGISGEDCNHGGSYGCWAYPGNMIFSVITYNNCAGCITDPLHSLPNRQGSMSVQAKQACPVGGGYKLSASKSMVVNYLDTVWYWWGTLQLIDNEGCQPS
jgi:hypothetical protein